MKLVVEIEELERVVRALRDDNLRLATDRMRALVSNSPSLADVVGVLGADELTPESISRELLDYLTIDPSRWCTTTQLTRETGLKQEPVLTALKLLLGDGVIEQRKVDGRGYEWKMAGE